uniref:Uncharacterized protein n=1 Tax=Cacopsylla melanoneura TaxID=428564 RepID=A0A8D8VRL0_9HEMI
MMGNEISMKEYVATLGLRTFLRGLREPRGNLMRTKNPKTLNEALNMQNFNKPGNHTNLTAQGTCPLMKHNSGFSKNNTTVDFLIITVDFLTRTDFPAIPITNPTRTTFNAATMRSKINTNHPVE